MYIEYLSDNCFAQGVRRLITLAPGSFTPCIGTSRSGRLPLGPMFRKLYQEDVIQTPEKSRARARGNFAEGSFGGSFPTPSSAASSGVGGRLNRDFKYSAMAVNWVFEPIAPNALICATICSHWRGVRGPLRVI